MLTKETLAWRGKLRSAVTQTVVEIQGDFGLRDVEQARAMLARALRSPILLEDLREQCAFYANGDELAD